jgi:hypothetical protein
VIQVALFLLRVRVQEQAALWPLMYVPLLLGGLYVVVLLTRLSGERRPGGSVTA